MTCPSCGAEGSPTARFCEQCGTRLARRCPACDHEVSPSARFCPECGAPLGTISPAPAMAAEVAPSPRSYTPPHLAERIVAGRAALEGERKQVTVLFADVVGSTELIRDRDAEEAQRLLDGVVQIMMDAVHRYEGTVSRLMGDGLMAMFGAPVAHEDHAVRACYAALAMQDATRRHLPELRRTYGAEVEIRVGLNSGEVVVRLVRDDLHMDYTAMGQTVHLAARMEQLARSGSVRLSAETLALVEGYVQVRSLGPVPIKGLPEPVNVFELLGAGQARTRLQSTAARGLTRFVGRQAELEALYGALERAGRGQGQVVALVGEPGVGKSRLVWELTHSHRIEGWTILESGSVSYGKATSYLPVIDLLKSYCRIESRDDERTIREKVTGKLLTLDEGLRPALPALLALLDVSTDDPSWEALDPAHRRRQTLDAVRRLLLRESQEQPLLLVFEDLHWIDSETQALLDGLVDSLPTARVLLLVNFRPEYHHAWGNKGYYAQLRIDPLGQEGADDLLRGLLGDDPSLEPLKSLLLARTEGNPLFLEESVRSLEETGTLAGERGAYRLPIPLASVRVPSTVQAIIAARIDRLPTEEKRLLQIAAVVGKDVPDALLRAVADRSEDDLRRGLAALQAAELLYEASLFPELEYTFKHALTHEVAYGGLLQERRQVLHARVVDAIERLYASRLEEQVERLAYHALRAEAWSPAVRYGRRAGQRALAQAAHCEAAAHLEQALSALSNLPVTRETLELGLDLRIEIRSALDASARPRELLAYLREAEQIAQQLGDERRLSGVSAMLSHVHLTLGEHDLSLETSRRAHELAEQVGDADLRVAATLRLARQYVERGELRRGTEMLRSRLGLLEGLTETPAFGYPASEQRAHYISEIARELGELGEVDDAIVHGEEAVRWADASGKAIPMGVTRNILGLVFLERGEIGRAFPLVERARAVLEAAEILDPVTWSLALLGASTTLSGRAGKGAALLEQALELADRIGNTYGEVRWTVWLAEAYLAAGRIRDAHHLAAHGLGLARARHVSRNEPYALRALGEIAAGSDPLDVETVEAHYGQALALAVRQEQRPLQAHCHLGLGKVHRQAGRLDEARAELSTAISMLREMGMTLWLPDAEAALAGTTGV